MIFAKAILVMASICFAVTSVHPVYGQLQVSFSVDVTLGNDGVYTYAYTLLNGSLSSQSINSVLLTTGQNAPIVDIHGPDENWFAAYAPDEEVFQAGFATGLSSDGEDCGVTDQFDLFQGNSIEFSISSPWAPAEQSYAIGRTVGRGSECDFVGDFSTGSIATPSTPIAECDFDRDGDCDLFDIDQLAQAISSRSTEAMFDLNLDTLIDQQDLDQFLAVNGRLNGDANFNGRVEFADFLLMSSSFAKNAFWSQGDFDASGRVAFADFLILSGNFGSSVVAANVPEPSVRIAYVANLILMATFRKRRTINHHEPNQFASGHSKVLSNEIT